MDKMSNEELLKWVVDYKYSEDDEGIGRCETAISVRDEDMEQVFETLGIEDKKFLMCSLIEMVGHPCEDYAEDFDDEGSAFGFECSIEGSRIAFRAVFRV